MICYRDMTFCKYWKNCKKGKGCVRALTKKVYKSAKAWWGKDNPPIYQFADKPECFKEKT